MEVRVLPGAFAAAGGQEAFPAIATWILRERVWHHLVENGTIPVREAIDRQRNDFPERGWWGTFWYIDPPNDPILGLRAVRNEDRTLQLAWRLDDMPEELTGLRGAARAAQFMAFVDDERGRVRSPEAFLDLVPLGLLDEDGTLRVPVHEWTPALPGTVASAAENAATTVAAAVAVLRQLARELGDEMGLPQAIAAYIELAPELMRSLDRMGLSVLDASLSDESAEQPERGQLSSVIWTEFPEEGPAVRLPW